MAEKVYELTSDQIGVIQFNNPWVFIHISSDDGQSSHNEFFSSVESGVKSFPSVFEEAVIKQWQANPDGEEKIERLRQYLLTTWWNPGVETMRKSMYEQYGVPEFKEKSGKDLIYDGYGFLGLTIAHIALRLNNKHFWFEGLHISTRVVDKFLSINFWEKLKTDALAQIGTTVFK